MKTYIVYYLVSSKGIEAGPFPTVDAAVLGKQKFIPPVRPLLTVVKSLIDTVPV